MRLCSNSCIAFCFKWRCRAFQQKQIIRKYLLSHCAAIFGRRCCCCRRSAFADLKIRLFDDDLIHFQCYLSCLFILFAFQSKVWSHTLKCVHVSVSNNYTIKQKIQINIHIFVVRFFSSLFCSFSVLINKQNVLSPNFVYRLWNCKFFLFFRVVLRIIEIKK